ncbi:MAG: hypothetical protein NT067_04140 [Candidatus Diapherotrites archaeon]|nr:hypothetical protein [Candidatus Diapherotrites archaeon]
MLEEIRAECEDIKSKNALVLDALREKDRELSGLEAKARELRKRNAEEWIEAIDEKLGLIPRKRIPGAERFAFDTMGETEILVLERLREQGASTYDTLVRTARRGGKLTGVDDGPASQSVILRITKALADRGIITVSWKRSQAKKFSFTEEGRAAYESERQKLLRKITRSAISVVERHRASREKLELRVLERIRRDGEATYDTLSHRYHVGGYAYGLEEGGIASVSTTRLIVGYLLGMNQITTRGTKKPVRFFLTEKGEDRLRQRETAKITRHTDRINRLREQREATTDRKESGLLWRKINDLIGKAVRAGVPRSELEKR